MNATCPIGVFDSGVGGLTVLKSLRQSFPQESFLYLGDTARLPYGTKSRQTIANYLEQNIQFLLEQKVKAIVVACNSASSVLDFREIDGIPVYGVIEPGARKAVGASRGKKIGVLGTRATVQSKCYKAEILKLSPDAEVHQVACPLFVPLAEEGLIDDPLTNLIVFRYLGPLAECAIDTLILGCTHYPVLIDSIRKVTGQQIELIESGDALATELAADFASGRLQKNFAPDPVIRILVTDGNHNMDRLAKVILKDHNYCDLAVVHTG